MLLHKDTTDAIWRAAIYVHTALGPGLLERVYELAMLHLLTKWGHHVRRQVEIPVSFDGVELGTGFRADLIVDGVVLLELKSVAAVHPVHFAQLQTYLKLSGLRVGVLLNFNVPLMKEGFFRRVV